MRTSKKSNLRRWFSRHRRREISLDDGEPGFPAFGDALADSKETQYEQVLRQERMRAVQKALAEVRKAFAWR